MSFTDIRAAIYLTRQTGLIRIQSIPRSWQVSVAIFMAGRVLLSLWGTVIWFMRLMPLYKGPLYYDIEPVLTGISGALLGIWQRWDGINYQQIAMYGYEDKMLSAFYPLYPLLGRLVSVLLGNNALLGLIIVSNAAFLLAIWLLYQIVCEEYTPTLAFETVFCLIIFPSTFFLYSIYPQSLLLMFVLLAYWLARRGQWAWAGLAALGAGLTHSTAAVLTLILGWEAVQSLLNKKEGNRTAMLIAPVMNLTGIGAFMAWRSLAGFPPYAEMLKQIWGRNTSLPWAGLIEVGKFIRSLPLDLSHFISWIYVFIFALIVGCTLWAFRRIPVSMWLYQAALLGMILCAGVDRDPLMGILRYPLVMFPLFIELAIMGNTKGWRLLKFFVFVVLGLVCSAWFFMWKFVG